MRRWSACHAGGEALGSGFAFPASTVPLPPAASSRQPFAAATSRLLADPDEAAAMGARGRALVVARYSAPAGATAMAGAAAAALGR